MRSTPKLFAIALTFLILLLGASCAPLMDMMPWGNDSTDNAGKALPPKRISIPPTIHDFKYGKPDPEKMPTDNGRQGLQDR